MNVAEVLSDLTSLRACDYNDALNLVTVNERLTASETAPKPVQAEATNEHLRLASELVELHHEMKAVHKDGRVDDQLRRGREEVNRVLRELATPSSR
ncbi:hypothetical protein ASPSYDRAFT_42641 [Aspergillus sydowii CBS 593.65]|uniref:Uncharacterized protein n=1 Tax=Aspergillus sydowii CBS 593.65 TaxID=1036612 RepID=A0A1L9TN50_9EURO|nr:uncharacterized protein ASPSYDRAFT_42641 [Aspergillus sydowii CBS 593.65]OJJ60844.1 hypothetical protein ASPSYDRAFT_42641 [Aspergillus sydowii CBS 593.65]